MRIVGPPLTAAKRAAAIAAARSCVGIQWRHLGRQGLPWGGNVGLDCIGMIGFAVWSVGRQWVDRPYPADPDGTLMPSMDAHLGRRVETLSPACVLALRFGRGEPRHVALLSESNTLIHCYDGGPRMVVEHQFDAAWRKRVVAGWQL